MKCTYLLSRLLLLLTVFLSLPALGQITPSDDAYILTSSPTKNFGTATTLEVESSGATTLLRFNLSGIPSTVTGSMVAKGTLKIFVGTVTTAGSFNVDLVTSSWAEGTVTANNAPSLGSAIASAVPVTTANKDDYILVDVTAAVMDWLNGTANDGLALVPDGAVAFTLNSKETTSTSHPAELDIVLTGPQGPAGPISGVTAGPGLTGGGTNGNVTVSMLTSCATNQLLQWNGSTWACSSAGTGTITGVTPGTGLTGGGTGGTVTLNVDTTKIAQLGTANNFTAPQEFVGNTGIGVAPSGTGYTPLSVGGATSFGTWLALANSSAGGHTWNIISAGSGNAEGAGNLGITDLTGKSTIWLEGNTNVTGGFATDVNGANTGTPTPGIQFGGSSSGEAVSSNRMGTVNRYGIDFYTDFTRRMSIANNGYVGIGTTNPQFTLDVYSPPSISSYAVHVVAGGTSNGIAAAGGSGTSGGYAFSGVGGDGSGSGLETGDGDGGAFEGGNTSYGGDGVLGVAGSGYAGYFSGNVLVQGNLYKSGGAFKIDDPLDPADKYLSHSFVESPDMMNIYNGNIVTDASGDAVVSLPEWFETLNRDFRYQLTVIGQFAQAIVTQEVANHQFGIKTDKPGVKVSWQVTGIRQDAWANAHRIPVEEDKDARERGHYIHPELYGAPEESSIEWARHPQMMKQLREAREKQALAPAAAGQGSKQPQ